LEAQTTWYKTEKAKEVLPDAFSKIKSDPYVQIINTQEKAFFEQVLWNISTNVVISILVFPSVKFSVITDNKIGTVGIGMYKRLVVFGKKVDPPTNVQLKQCLLGIICSEACIIADYLDDNLF